MYRDVTEEMPLKSRESIDGRLIGREEGLSTSRRRMTALPASDGCSPAAWTEDSRTEVVNRSLIAIYTGIDWSSSFYRE